MYINPLLSVFVSEVRDWFWETGDVHQTGQTGRGEDKPAYNVLVSDRGL